MFEPVDDTSFKKKKKKKVVSATSNEHQKENQPETGPLVVNEKRIVETNKKKQEQTQKQSSLKLDISKKCSNIQNDVLPLSATYEDFVKRYPPNNSEPCEVNVDVSSPASVLEYMNNFFAARKHPNQNSAPQEAVNSKASVITRREDGRESVIFKSDKADTNKKKSENEEKNEVCKTVIQTQEVSRKKGSFSDQIVISDKESEREMTPYYTHKIFDKLKPKQTT